VDATLYHSSGGNTDINIKNHSYGVTDPYIDMTAQNDAVTTFPRPARSCVLCREPKGR